MKKILLLCLILLVGSFFTLSSRLSVKAVTPDNPLSDLAVDLKEAEQDTNVETQQLRQEVTKNEVVVGGEEDGDPKTPPEEVALVSDPTDDELTEEPENINDPNAENSENIKNTVIDSKTGQELPVDQGEVMKLLPDNNDAPEATPTQQAEEPEGVQGKETP